MCWVKLKEWFSTEESVRDAGDILTVRLPKLNRELSLVAALKFPSFLKEILLKRLHDRVG